MKSLLRLPNSWNVKGVKRIILLLLLSITGGFGQERQFPFRLSPQTEFSILIGNVALAGSNSVLRGSLQVPEPEQILLLDKDRLFFIDRVTYQPFNHSVERASHYMMLSAISLPLLLAPLCQSGGELFTLGVIGLETYMTTYLTIQTLKLLTRRPRPVMYSNDYNISEYKGIQSLNSFPSGHAAMAFSAAGFIHACYLAFLPKGILYSVLKYTTYAAALSAGFLRYRSGVHHLTDVIVGSAIGYALGYVIPQLHAKNTNNQRLSISLDPFHYGRLSVQVKF
ncbi:MAG: phosphatase PAP2 family protein [Thermaurantimonas sp.]